jgi:MFS family permease
LSDISPSGSILGAGKVTLLSPFRELIFRRLWLSSMIGNQGLMIMSVGAAWMMTRISDNSEMVALVQTSLMLPLLLVALPSGALADMFDRRTVAICAVLLSLAGGSLLFAMAFFEILSPFLLLLMCFVMGTGYALFGPVWQASAAEIVERSQLPQAIALNSMSYNAARTVGPALGGVIVATGGVTVAFGLTAMLYLPLLFVLIAWKRASLRSHLAPENFLNAMGSAVRFASNSPIVRSMLVKAFATGTCAASLLALLPLVARDLLGGDPQTFGFCLGAYGLGAILAALLIQRLRARFNDSRIIICCLLAMAMALVIISLSRTTPVTLLALVIFGGGWLAIATTLNITIQLSAPRWVTARAVASYQACLAGGIALGSWLWGIVADRTTISEALIISAGAVAVTILIRRSEDVIPVDRMHDTVELPPFEPAFKPIDRSGPILVEIDYRVDPQNAEEFYWTMEKVRASRARLGAHSWQIARCLSDTWIWTERYQWPTWLDYMRHRTRHTEAEREIQNLARAFHEGENDISVRRYLEKSSGFLTAPGEAGPGLEGSEPRSINI